MEYIIIDGGSTDESVEIIRKYEPWLAYWVSEPDRGQSHAINKGFERSTGEIMAWINSDDYYAPGAFSIISSYFLRKNSETLGFVHGKAILVDEENHFLGYRGGELNLIESLRTSVHPIAQPSVFFKAIILKEIGFLDEHLHMSMDWDLFLRISVSYDVEFVTEVLSYFRVTPFTKTSKNLVGFGPDRVLILKKIYNEYKLPSSLLKVKREAFCTAYLRCVSGYLRQNRIELARKSYFLALLSHPLIALKRFRKYARRLILG